MRSFRWFPALLAAAALAAAPAGAKTFTVDPDHTGVTFQVRHLFTYVDGRFRTFQGTIEYDPSAPDRTKVRGTIDVTSIDTNVAKRDEHLRSADFFDAGRFPKIEFVSTGVSDVDRATNSGTLTGNLTMHGVTKPVALRAQFLGEATDPWGNKKAGFHAETTINRKDWGLNWNKTVETGGVLVGDEVKIRIDAEGGLEE